MCGIFGTRQHQDPMRCVASGLNDLAYRGYDSWGIAGHDDNGLTLMKQTGLIPEKPDLPNITGHMAIGHTRWSTHGIPSIANAHPHLSLNKNIAIVHNGIIENHAALKKTLPSIPFSSETDSEVIAHLISNAKQMGHSLIDAVRSTADQLIGRYAILVIDYEENSLVALRQGSPLVAATDGQCQWVASDIYALSRQTDQVIYLEDKQILCCDANGLSLLDPNNQPIPIQSEPIDRQYKTAGRGTFRHFMRKEIAEQTAVIKETIQHQHSSNCAAQITPSPRRIIILGCGTSWHAGLVAEYWLESLAKIPVEVEYASEFRYRDPLIGSDDYVIALSQSGETADTNAAAELAKSNGATLIAICNVPGSTLTRMADQTYLTHAGAEIGVASTKAFTTQLATLYAMALDFAEPHLPADLRKKKYDALKSLPEWIEKTLAIEPEIETIAQQFYQSDNALFLGRGLHFPIALEGALKLKEVSYIHAEGYPAAEMKHGPIALIDADMPVFVIATQDHTYHKVIANIEEVKARKGTIIAIGTEGDKELPQLADHLISVPHIETDLLPIITVLPLQLLAYHIADRRGCDIDKPRNLAKSVTVE